MKKNISSRLGNDSEKIIRRKKIEENMRRKQGYLKKKKGKKPIYQDEQGFWLYDLIITLLIVCVLFIGAYKIVMVDKVKTKKAVSEVISVFTSEKNILEKGNVGCVDGCKTIIIDKKLYYLSTEGDWDDLKPVPCKGEKDVK